MLDNEVSKSGAIGVVTVTYNSESVLPDFLTSIWAQEDCTFVLYAVDNASKDATLQLLRNESDKRLRTIPNSQNIGVAEANNIGIRQALNDGCDYILLLNNDVVFEANLFSRLQSGLTQFECDMIAPKITYFEPANLLWWAGGTFHNHSGCRTEHYGFNQVDAGQFDNAAIVEYAPTCCLLVKKRLFEEIGMFDSRYFVYYDDTDFMYRAYLALFKLCYFPHATLKHKVSSLTGKNSLFSVRFCTRNRVYFWSKHFGLARALAGSLILACIYIARAIMKRSTGQVLRTQLKALREGLQMCLQPQYPSPADTSR